jgi:ABC-type bacteriocin/lantibiotic exporter with double-glycine peptidase domain
MKTIKQKEENDCGVACVAMLTGTSYDEARAAIYPKGRSKLTKTKDLHSALVKLGRKPLSVRRQPFASKTLRDLDTDALVFVEMDDGDDSKHWVVWDAKAKKLRDPYRTKHEHRLRGYLAVE